MRRSARASARHATREQGVSPLLRIPEAGLPRDREELDPFLSRRRDQPVAASSRPFKACG